MAVADVYINFMDDDPNGMAKIWKNGTSVQVFRIPQEAVERSDDELLKKACIYILVYYGDGQYEPVSVYVGQADVGQNKLSFHRRMKEHIGQGTKSWKEVIVITCSGEELRDSLKYVENTLYWRIKNANRYQIAQTVPEKGSLTTKEEINVNRSVIEPAMLLIKHLGYRFFTPIDESKIEAAKVLLQTKGYAVKAVNQSEIEAAKVLLERNGYEVKKPEAQEASSFQSPEFYLKQANEIIYATMVFLTPDFRRGVLKSGSRVQIKTASSCSAPAKRLRNTHLTEEKIEAYDDKHIKLKCDIDFSTESKKEEDMCASLAAGFVSGNSMSGSAWRTADNLTPEQYRNSLRHN